MTTLVQAGMTDTKASDIAKDIIHKYFQTHMYPFTFHHIESYNQFLREDLPNLIQSYNPITLFNSPIAGTNRYNYKVEIWVGGQDGKGIYIGTPTISLQNSEEVRVLMPNEARLRNLTYASNVSVDIYIKVSYLFPNPDGPGLKAGTPDIIELKDNKRITLFRIPILLHSQYCLLNNKPAEFLREAGECEYDYGGYFIVDGAEKILVTRQEKAFNTLVMSLQKSDPKVAVFAKIICLNPKSHLVKNVTFHVMRNSEYILVGLPFIRSPIPLFVLFRALGVQSDLDILTTIFPNQDSSEAKLLIPYLLPSILQAQSIQDTVSAIKFMKTLTKGFSEEHVIDILYNQTFIHIENRPMARVAFLAECVRKILRVYTKIDQPTDRDDIRNQRCLTAGFACQMLLQGIYKMWVKKVRLNIDREYNGNPTVYKGSEYAKIFGAGNQMKLFDPTIIMEQISRAFHGKWSGSVGESKDGNLQSLSRLSYHDFLSHCRRMNLEFDTSKKDAGPRRLHPSQFGYYCTNETPTGGSIGITKNLSIMTAISTALQTKGIVDWLFNPNRGGLIPCDMMTSEIVQACVPLFLNGGILGYTQNPFELTEVLRLMKRSGFLPAYTSVGFSIDERRILLYLDEGRPLRPLIYIQNGKFPEEKLSGFKTWRNLVMGKLENELVKNRQISDTHFVDPFVRNENKVSLKEYITYLSQQTGCIEYIDPYEHNLIYIAMYPKYVNATTTHVEIHPSTMLGMMTNMIPFAHHNQSPRNQLSCSQSKQGLSIFSTKYRSRFDNQVHVLCYGEAPLSRTIYYDYVADGNIGYGHNLILAIGSCTGYNQDDGILMNKDSFDRGMFRNMSFRSYAACEINDPETKTQTRIAHPKNIPNWTDLKLGLDYSKLDERGIIDLTKNYIVNQNTVLVSMFMLTEGGVYKDVSITPQVWTSGRVDDIAVTVDNNNLRMVKIRITQDRIPELGDKFSNRHGQKGTIGMLIPACDMPRTKDGIVPDMIMNPHAIPSRMTIGQLLETILGKAASIAGAIGNATSFMNDGDPTEYIGKILEEKNFEKYGNEILYDGTSGVQIPSAIFIGQCYTMRLKHMTQDKWNARAAGRREARTHQPTGGRGNEGGLRIGEMERDALSGHGISEFLQESFMKRSDETEFLICNGCGTVPIYNHEDKFYFCTLCDGPAAFAGSKANDLTLIPPNKRSSVTFSKIKMPYATFLLGQELTTYMNMGIRFLTAANVERLRQPSIKTLMDSSLLKQGSISLKQFVPPTNVPAITNPSDLALATKSPGEGEENGEGDELDAYMKEMTNAENTLEQREAENSSAIDAASRLASLTVNQGQGQGQGQGNLVANITIQNPSAATTGQPQGALPPKPETSTFALTETTNTQPGAFPATLTLPPPGSEVLTNMQGGYQQVTQNVVQPMVQPLAQRQIVETFAPPPEAQIFPPMIPGAPPNIVVATDPVSMMAAGFRPMMGGATNVRPMNSGPKMVGGAEASSVNPSAKITVIKQG